MKTIKHIIFRIPKFIVKMIKWTPILWEDKENDFFKVIHFLKNELESIDNKNSKEVIEHINRYLNILEYTGEKDDVLDILFGKKKTEKHEKLEMWHLSESFRKLYKIIRKEYNV